MATVLRPNTSKVLMMSLLKVLSGVVVIILVLVVLEFSVGLDLFTGIFESFNITLNPDLMLQVAIMIVIGIAVLMMIGSYFSVMSIQYEFFEDRMTYQSSTMFILKNKKTISYKNISKATYDDKDFFNGLLNTGTVILDLSSLGEKELRLEHVDRPQEATEGIGEILRSYNLRVQAEYTEKHKMKELLDEKGL